MRSKGSVGIFLLVMLLLLSLGAAGLGFYYFYEERLTTEALKEELKNLKAEKNIADTKLAESKVKIDELNAQLKFSQEQASELSTALEKVDNEKNQLDSQIEMLQSQLREQEKIKKEWEVKGIQAKEQIDKLLLQFRELKTSKEKLEAELSELKANQEVALGKIVVEQEEGGQQISTQAEASSAKLQESKARSKLEGEVLVINDEYDFAIIDLGNRDGIDVGDVFLVYHNDSYIGNIRVDRIQETMSACVFASEGINGKIREGDKVITK